MANTEVNKVLTSFEVETKNFTKDVKAAEKNVENLKKQFKETNKQVDALKKDIKGLGDEIDKLDDLDLEIDASNLKREVATAQKELAKVEDIIHDIDKAADGALDGLSGGRIDLRVFTRIEDMLRRMGDIDVIDIDSIRRAANEVDNLVSDLKAIDTDINVDIQSKLDDLTVELDTGRLTQLKLNLDDNLRHWIDNSNGGLNQASDDTHKVLQDILTAVRNVTAGDNSDRPVQQLETDGFERASKRMSAAVDDLAGSMKNYDTATEENIRTTKEYEKALASLSQKLNLQEMPEFGDAIAIDDDLFKSYDVWLDKLEKSLKTASSLQEELNQDISKSSKLYAESVAQVDHLQTVFGEFKASADLAAKELARIPQELEIAEEKFKQLNQVANKTENQLKELDWVSNHISDLKEQEKALRELNQYYAKQENHLSDILKTNRQISVEMQNAYKVQGKVTKQTEKQADATDKLKESLGEIGKALEPLTNATGLDKVTGSLGTITTSASGAAKGIKGLSSAMSGLSATAVAGLGAAGVAVGALAAGIANYVASFKLIKFAIQETLPAYEDLENAITRVQTAMGDAAASYEDTKKMLTDGFANQGHVQDVNEYADALARVNQQLVDLAGFDYQDVGAATNDILTFSKISGYDPNEIIRAARNMSINFGTEVSTVLDMMTSAYQRTGDPMNDLLDTMQEYPSQFRKMGLSAETFYDLIVRGSEAGVYNTDKIADTFKELYLRIAEGADVPVEELKKIGYTADDIARVGNATDDVINGFNKLGLSVNDIKRAFEQGGDEASSALYTIIDAIAAVEDKAEQQDIIAKLFGAPGEDVGSYFFEVLANGEIAVDEFVGAVENAAATMESTLSYQMTEVQNKVTTLKAEIGDTFGNVLTLALQDINANFESISAAVTGSLIPALEMLGFALADPFIEADQSASDFIINLIEGISGVIEGMAMFVNVMNGVGAVIRIVWNVFQLGCRGALVALATLSHPIVAIGQLLANAFLSGLTWCNEFILVCQGGFGDVVTFAKNCGVGIQNAFGRAFSETQKFFASMVNGFVDTWNKTVAKIPGFSSLNHVSWGSSYTPKDYYDYSGRKAFEGNGWKGVQDKVNDAFTGMLNTANNIIQTNMAGFGQDLTDIMDAASDIGKTFSFNSRFDDIKNKLDAIKKEQKAIEKQQDAINKKPVKPPVTDKYNGSNTDSKKTAEDIAKAEKEAKDAAKKKKETQKKQNDLKKKEQALQKELNELLKQEKELQKEIFDETKRQIELEKQYADDRRSWEEAIMAQQVKLRQDKEEALLLEMAMIDEIRNKYELTAEEQISYQQKQFDLALSLRDYYLSFYKEAVNKEIQAVKDRASEELKIEKNKNDKLIKDKERQIKAIEALMRENEYNNDQEDLDYEIKKTEEELQKYLYATSFDGINKRNELEEKLRELRLEKERAAKKKELEDQKQQLEDEIDQIKDANEEAEKAAEEKAEAMEKIYDDMFAELEEVINSGMLDIGKVQELAQKETNATIKNLLNGMVAEYENALKLIEKYTLNMKDIISWDKNDAHNDIIEGGMTGDQDKVNNGNDILDKNENWKPGGGNASESTFKQAQAKYNKLKKEHSSLSAKKDKTAAEKARLKAIEKEVAELKKVWGFNGFQDTSQFKPVNTQANASQDKIDGLNSQINASKSRSVGTNIPDYIRQVPSFNNSFNPQVMAADAGQRQNMQSTVVNNNSQETKIDSMIKIENFNNNSNADIKKIGQQLNATMAVHDRALGRRKI